MDAKDYREILLSVFKIKLSNAEDEGFNEDYLAGIKDAIRVIECSDFLFK